MQTMGPSRRLGRRGLAVTPVGLGLAALGRPGYINLGHDRDFPGGRSVEAMRDATFAVLDAARAAGVRYVDAARSYGRAEEFLAAWLGDRAVAPDEITVGTKWGYTYVADWQTDAAVHEVKDHSLATLERQIGESTVLLGRHLDLLQVHSATLDSGVLQSGVVLDALVGLRRDGVVRAIGLSLSGPGQAATLRAAMSLVRDGEPVFDTVQATFNVLERSAGPALAEAHERGMGVLVKEALANGRLVRGDVADRLRPAAEASGVGVDAVALRFVLDQPWADVTLLGPATVSQLHENLRALDSRLDDDADRLLAALVEAPELYWRRRARLPWH
jgi:aryl-alcohol dehydrogenase-like predicted oxidoreductase